MDHYEIRVDEERCIGCWECVDLCPQTGGREYPVYSRGERMPEVVNPESCLGCLTCVTVCRAEAVTVLGKRAVERAVERRAQAKDRTLF